MTEGNQEVRSDDADRARIRTELQTSFLVEAAPGTGKTYELVERIVACVEDGTPIEGVVAITFTRKAAGELKLRLRRALDQRARGDNTEHAQRCRTAAARLEEAHVGTIDSFCAELLRQHPVEAQVDPSFSELGEGEDLRLFARVFDTWFDAALQSPSETLERMLARPRAVRSKSVRELLRASAWELAETIDEFDAPWPDESDAPVVETLDVLKRLVVQHYEEARDNDDRPRWYAVLEETALWLGRFGPQGEPSRGHLEARLLELDKVKPLPPDIRKQLGTLSQRIDSDLAARVRLELLQVLPEYAQTKRELGVLDFSDLRRGVRKLLGSNAEVREQSQLRFQRIFVDEFQDTSQVQLEIVSLLAADNAEESDPNQTKPRPGAMFLVGDPKQSIYRFRGADPGLYKRTRGRLQGHGLQLLRLSHSFRGTGPVQAFINTAFEQALDSSHQPGFSPLLGGPSVAEGVVSVAALPIPHVKGASHWPNKKKVQASFPGALAAFVDWLVHRSGWTVRDPDVDSRRVPVRPEHIAVLFKRLTSTNDGVNFRDFTEPYREALDAHELPYGLIGMRSFFERPEVEALHAAARCLEWPEDELALYATLRGPLFCFHDELLLKARLQWSGFDYHKTREHVPDELSDVDAALTFLQLLSKQRNEQPFVQTLQQLLSQARLHVVLMMEPGGANLLANVQGVLDLARSYESSGGISWRGLITRLEEEMSKARSSDNRAFEAEVRGVRMMSTWQAKGLEFPVVILADPGGPRQLGPYVRKVQRPEERLMLTEIAGLKPLALEDAKKDENLRTEADNQRLAYVAATRARDLLVFGATGARDLEPVDGWSRELDALARSCQAPPDGGTTCRDPGPQFGAGWHSIGSDGVHWVDLDELNLDRQPHRGLRQEGLLLAQGPAAEQSVADHAAWKSARTAKLRAGARPDLALVRPGDSEAPEPPEAAALHVEVLPRAPDRPRGPRFGVLVHECFRLLPLDADAVVTLAIAQTQGRLLGATDQEVKGAAEALTVVLSHGLIQRVRAAQSIHRELSLSWLTDEGLLIDGAADLVFVDAHGLGVIEIKTHADPLSDREAHERQLRWYLAALGSQQMSPIYGALLYV